MHVYIAKISPDMKTVMYKKYPCRLIDGPYSYMPRAVLRDLAVPMKMRVHLDTIDNDAYMMYSAVQKGAPMRKVLYVVSSRAQGVLLGDIGQSILGMKKTGPIHELECRDNAERSPSPHAGPNSSRSTSQETLTEPAASDEPTRPTPVPVI
jgi:hypothetical protein